jgi:hypothetical protein
MKIEKLACPSCGAPLSGDFAFNQKFQCNSCGSTLILEDLATPETIICPTCRIPNHQDMRFCSNCGEKLRLHCVMCHTENRVDAVYCVTCGIHLQRADAQQRHLLEKRQRLLDERQQALREKTERQKEEKLQRLLDALDEPENHDFAIYQLNQLGIEAIEPLIETLLRDTDPDARYGSAIALGQICREQAITGLIKARAVKALITALADPESAVRYWAADALGQFKGPQTRLGIEPLTALLKDPHPGVRQQAQKSLQQLRTNKEADLKN